MQIMFARVKQTSLKIHVLLSLPTFSGHGNSYGKFQSTPNIHDMHTRRLDLKTSRQLNLSKFTAIYSLGLIVENYFEKDAYLNWRRTSSVFFAI